MIELLKTLPVNRDTTADWFNAPNNYPRLCELATELKPRSILEIGVRLGYSAISFLHGSDANLYVGLDCEKYIGNSQSSASQNLEYYRKSSGRVFDFELITVDTQSIADVSVLGGRTFDLVHVDGDHTERGAYKDLVHFWDVVNVGGHMLVDDSTFIKAVRRAVDRFLLLVSEPNWEVSTFRGTWVISKTH